MPISKNWKVVFISGTAGNEIIVTGEANVGLLTVMPALEKRIPQGINPTILQLDLLNAGDAVPENFKPVKYNELLTIPGQYQSVEVFHNNDLIEEIKISATHPVTNPTWYGEIRHMFTQTDIEHMRSQGIELTDYITVKDMAANIYGQVAAGNMPPDNSWLADWVQTFLNWMTNDCPKGQPAVFEKMQFMAAGLNDDQSKASRIRKEILELDKDEIKLLKEAFTEIMKKDHKDPDSYFAQASWHGFPNPKCMHHIPGYNPWHRALLVGFENALRLVPGCEKVTLPFWDFTQSLLPPVFSEEPFASYTLPIAVGPGFAKGYITKRNTAEEIRQKLAGYDVAGDLARAALKTNWEDFHGFIAQSSNNTTIEGHDEGHLSMGSTMAKQEVAAFDPLFWFFHCNLDRLFWEWQKKMEATNLKGLLTTISSPASRNIFLVPVLMDLAPFTKNPPKLNTVDIIDSANSLDVDYKTPTIPSDMNMLTVMKGSTNASDKFIVHKDFVNVRVKGVNRLKIPGSFNVHLLKDEKIIATKGFFQPSEVEKCENCVENAIAHFDFELPLEEVTNGKLGVRVEPLDHTLFGDRFPNKMMGNPTVNVRLLLSNE